MRSNVKRFLKFLLISIVLSSFAWAKSAPEQSELSGLHEPNGYGQTSTVRLSWGEWPPFHSASLPFYGLYSHIVQEVFAAVGVTVEYTDHPWIRAYKMALSGELDGTVVWTRTPDRESNFIFSDPIDEGCVVYFYKKETQFEWKTFQDLAKYIIGATRGYRAQDELEFIRHSGIPLTYEITSSDLQNMKKLVAGRIDAFTCHRVVGNHLLRHQFSEQDAEMVTYHAKPMFCDDYYAIFPKEKMIQSQQWVRLFNEGLKKIKANGTYQEIMEAFRNGAYELPVKNSDSIEGFR